MQAKSLFNKVDTDLYFQAFIIGFSSFTQVGVWIAIANLGGGGLLTATTNNIASAVTFGVMAILCPFWGILTNMIGIKPVIFIGNFGYILLSWVILE